MQVTVVLVDLSWETGPMTNIAVAPLTGRLPRGRRILNVGRHIKMAIIPFTWRPCVGGGPYVFGGMGENREL